MNTVRFQGTLVRKLFLNRFCSLQEILSHKGMVVCTVKTYERKANLLLF